VHLETWSQGQLVRQTWKNQSVLRGERWEQEEEQRKTSERAGLQGAAAWRESGGFSDV